MQVDIGSVWHFKNVLFLRVESAKLSSYVWKALVIADIKQLRQKTALLLCVVVWQSKECDAAFKQLSRWFIE